jgi:hypothetical protein
MPLRFMCKTVPSTFFVKSILLPPPSIKRFEGLVFKNLNNSLRFSTEQKLSALTSMPKLFNDFKE